MRKMIGIIAFLLGGLLILSFTSVNRNPAEQLKASPRERKIQKEVYSQIVSFRDYVRDSLLLELSKAQVDTQRLKQSFLKSRLLFKRFEWASTYFTADLNKRLNGPPVQEIENADLLDPSLARAVDPTGLQVIEELLYPDYDASNRAELLNQVSYLITNTGYLISYFDDHELADWRILDAAKLQVFRITALGIAGFDDPHSLNSMAESAESLRTLRRTLASFITKRIHSTLLTDLDAAIAYLDRYPDFNSFDRAAFITRFSNKISTDIAQMERELPGPKIKYNRMLRQDVNTLFDADAFNVDAFSPGPDYHMTDAKISLGEKLFNDVALSGTGTRSCASCHKPALAFADGLVKQTDIHDPSRLVKRNATSLLNVAFQSNYFYDMRALTLEDQVHQVIGNKQELDGSMDAVVKRVAADKTYFSLFKTAYSTATVIDADQVANAIASYVRSLTSLNSRFDEYMSGNQATITSQEIKGFNLFMGKAKCGTCHFVPLFNGITPPKYVSSETEVLGVPVSLQDSTVDADPGYYGVIGIDSYKHAFKVPTIRNSSKTAPYMHNGVYSTLDQVMDFYNNGGGAGLGINLPNQTLAIERLQLSDSEKVDIIAFIRSLDSQLPEKGLKAERP